jgi:hypothetical protein
MESGLKQRKTAQNLNEGKRYPDDGDNRNESDKEIDQEVDEDAYDADSKETRLTLMEEVLLLGLKDREVKKKPHQFSLKYYHNLIVLGLYFILERLYFKWS